MGQVDRPLLVGGSAFSAFSPRRDSETSIVRFCWRSFPSCSPKPGEQPPQNHAGWSLANVGNSPTISTVTNRNQYDSGRRREHLLELSKDRWGFGDRRMTRVVPFTQANVRRTIAAAQKAGLQVTAIRPDGTILVTKICPQPDKAIDPETEVML
jgi:hypothetical protein